MRNKLLFSLFIFVFIESFFFVKAEIIKISNLKEKEKKFVFYRDIFSPYKSEQKEFSKSIKIKKVETQPQKKKVDIKKNIEDEVSQRLSYEGYIAKNENYRSIYKPRTVWVYVLKDKKENRRLNAIMESTNIHALLAVSGEYFIVSAGDIILGKIMILKIEKKQITVEVDSHSIEITLKEDKEEQRQ